MRRFHRTELDRFNDRIQNVLENKDCVGIFKAYLRQQRPELYDVFRLWRKAHKAKLHGRSVTDSMRDLLEGLDEFDGDLETASLDDIMTCCCDTLDAKVHEFFVEYLRQHHRN